MKRKRLISHETVFTPENLLLLEAGKNKFSSRFYDSKPGRRLFKLKSGSPDSFYPEICMLFTLRADDVDSLFQKDFIIASGRDPGTENGWDFYIDQYSSLRFRGTGDYDWLKVGGALTQPTLSSFAGGEFRVGFVYSCSARARERGQGPQHYLKLMASSGGKSPMYVISGGTAPYFEQNILPDNPRLLRILPVINEVMDKLEKPSTPVTRTLSVPLLGEKQKGLSVESASAWNSVQYELFIRTPGKKTAGCGIKQDFSGASRAFSIYEPGSDTLELFSGPEFMSSSTYWLFARVKGAVPGKTRIRIFFEKEGRPNMHPVMFYSTDRRKWSRAETLEPAISNNVFYPLVLAPAKEFYLSTSIPFMVEELELLKKETSSCPFVKIINAGKSVEGRRIEMFKVTDAGTPDREKKHFALIAGQHSPQEMLGAHFLRPMLEYLSSNPRLLKRMVLYFAPVVNMDCAFWGSSGSNLNGMNINRCWESNMQPESRGIKEYFLRLKRRGLDLDVFIDLHAGGTFRNHPIFFHTEENWKKIAGKGAGRMIELQERFLAVLEKHAGIRREDGSAGSSLRFGKANAAGSFQHIFRNALSYTLELSTSSFFDPVSRRSRVLNQDSLEVTGEGVLKAFLEYAGLE